MKNKLIELIKKGENEKVEFKPSLSQINEIINSISAFSNKNGGKIVIGVSLKGKILGVQIGEDTIERLTNKIRDNTEPKVYPSISVNEINKKKIIIIEIEEAINKPVLAFGRAFKRVGKSTLKMSKDEYEKIVLEKKNLYFDLLQCKNASIDDIDWNFVKKFFIPRYEEITKSKIVSSPKQLLEALNCIKNNKPTNAGILLFGKNPQKFFMNSYIALARYKGNIESSTRLDYKEFVGNLFQQIDNCDKYIKEHITVMSRLHPYKVEREDIPEYGLFSIRELIINAVCHRDYSEQRTKVIIKMFSDRIEYYNPGGLPKEITPENILDKQFSRNPIIAKVLAKVKYIEELGEGWNKIIDEHKKHPLKPKLPKIEADEYTVLVKLFSAKEKFVEHELKYEIDVGRRKRLKIAVEYVKERGSITNAEYQKINKVSRETATRDLKELVTTGILKTVGSGRRGLRYVLTQKMSQKMSQKMTQKLNEKI